MRIITGWILLNVAIATILYMNYKMLGGKE